MANLFDPKNPKTWPENFKKPTSAFTVPGQKPTGLRKLTLAEEMARAQTEAQNYQRWHDPTWAKAIPGAFELVGKGVPALLGADKGAEAIMDPTPANIAEAVLAMGKIKAAGKLGSFLLNNTYALGKTVVHGSPQKGLKEIKPQTGSARFPDDEIAYGWNPRFNQNTGANWMTDASKQYMGDSRSGSLYVGKIPRNAILEDPDPALGDLMVLGGKPIRVKKEFPQRPVPQGEDVITWNATQDKAMKEALAEYLRRRGLGPTPKNPLDPAIKKFKNHFNPPPPKKAPVA